MAPAHVSSELFSGKWFQVRRAENLANDEKCNTVEYSISKNFRGKIFIFGFIKTRIFGFSSGIWGYVPPSSEIRPPDYPKGPPFGVILRHPFLAERPHILSTGAFENAPPPRENH